ncbi:MAG: VIT family protein [Rhodobacteraceae bacterium]|nr:VIT family protein [Paracoccaceae bacterium]
MPPHDQHFVTRTGGLRAAVMGANDGIVSTASLVVGVASAGSGHSEVLLAGVAGAVAGALSMAAGEYVSVSSQSDSEAADLAREKAHLEVMPEAEHEELTHIYRERGVEHDLAHEVARQMMEHDALEAHARDELGIMELNQARPMQAAVFSAAAFIAGAALPIAGILVVPHNLLSPVTMATSVMALGLLGTASARMGGAPVVRAVARVTFWGVAAMAATAAVGALFGVALG